METEKKIGRRQFLKKAVADLRLLAEGSVAVYLAVLREGSQTNSKEVRRVKEINDPVNVALICAGLVAISVAIARRLPEKTSGVSR